MAAGNSYPEGGDRVPFLSDIKSMPLMLQRQRPSTGSVAVIAGIFAFLIPVCLPVTAHACDVPVYQYALENWQADFYEVVVFHRCDLSEAQREAVQALRQADSRRGRGNLALTTVDLDDDPDPVMLQRWREQKTTKLPRLAAWYPSPASRSQLAWAGPLTSENVDALLNSPLRQKIADELIGDATAVWVLLESGDRKKDEAAAALLDRELRRLEETMELTVPDDWATDADEDDLGPVEFRMHRLSRQSSKERIFVDMLVHSEDDLATDFASEPLVFPIYGRGLILYALAGPGINEWTIEQAAEFMTGPCSCEVKAGNPGTDMLTMVDWAGRVTPAQQRLPPPTGIASFQDRAAEAKRRFAEVEKEHTRALAGEAEKPGANGQGTGNSDAASERQSQDAHTGRELHPVYLLAALAGVIIIALTAATVVRYSRKDG